MISEQRSHHLGGTNLHRLPGSSSCPYSPHLGVSWIFSMKLCAPFFKTSPCHAKLLNRKLRASTSHSSSKTSSSSFPTWVLNKLTEIHAPSGGRKVLQFLVWCSCQELTGFTSIRILWPDAICKPLPFCQATRETNSFSWFTTAVARLRAPFPRLLRHR